MSQNVPGSPVIKCAASTMKHCYVRCTRKSVYSLFMQSTWPRPLSQKARWWLKCWKESSTRRFDGKERKDKRVYRSLVHKIKEKSVWRVTFVQLPCLPTCNYGNRAPYHGLSISATRPTSSSRNSVAKYSVLEATKQIFCVEE